MDASAYLRNHGWRGHGHSLDHTNRGITKPLLISKKVDVLGVGLNKHSAVSDQWWMRAFDQGLKSLGTGEQTALSQVQKHGVHRGGLYANFVKGELYEGSIGTSVLPTPEDSEDAVERLPTEGAIVATMSTKRKREADEEKVRPRVKRARRKLEKAERERAHVVEKRAEERRKGIEDGTYDEKAEAEKILARKREKDINKQANEFILDAQRRGIIPYGPNEIRKGLIPTGANATVLSEPSQDLLTVLSGAGIDPTKPITVSGSVKAQKYARMKVQREVNRSAKAYLMGESLPPLPSTKEERKRLKKELKKKNAPTGLEKAQKRAERMRAQAEKVAANVEKNRRRKATRERKQEENEVINQIIAERDAAKTMDGQKLMKAKKIDPAAFDNDADETKLNINAKGTLRKVPGVGVVDKYPSKGEKKAKKEAAIAIKQEIGAEECKRGYSRIELRGTILMLQNSSNIWNGRRRNGLR
jgi:nucleolar protein TMA23